MEYIKTENEVHIFKDYTGNIYKVGITVGSVEDARNLLLFPPSAKELNYKIKRKIEYENNGLTLEAFTIACIQKELDGDSSELDNYKTKRAEIKVAIPKN